MTSSFPDPGGPVFRRDGAQIFRSALGPASVSDIYDALAHLPPDQAGIRLRGLSALRPVLMPTGAVGAVAAEVLGASCRPVRAILFDKTPASNWSLGWHQDRTIIVAERAEVEGFGPWTVKQGLQHVAPPFEILAAMVTLRVHLDPVSADNGPLLVALGSHRLGPVPEAEMTSRVRECRTFSCLADAGDIWLYATPILHASEAALEPTHRRVLQVDYAACALPGGLEWLGV